MFILRDKINDVALALADCFRDRQDMFSLFAEKEENLRFGMEILGTLADKVNISDEEGTMYDLIVGASATDDDIKNGMRGLDYTGVLVLACQIEWISRNNCQLSPQNKKYTAFEASCFMVENGYAEKLQWISDVCTAAVSIRRQEYRGHGNVHRFSSWVWNNMELQDIYESVGATQAEQILVFVDKVPWNVDIQELGELFVIETMREAEKINPENILHMEQLGRLITAYALDANVQERGIAYFNETVQKAYESEIAAGNDDIVPPKECTNIEEAHKECRWRVTTKNGAAIEEIILKHGLREDYAAICNGVPLVDILAGI